jgi:hypothetical protein
LSDIGTIFPFWFTAGLALILALPVTTAIMVGLGVAAYRIRRRDRSRRLTGLKWSAIAVAPFWLGGLALGGWILLSLVLDKIEGAQRDFTLDKAAEVDGVALPAGTRVELDESRVLKVAELPDGAAVTLRGASWRGRIEFAEPAHAPNAAHGQITDGTLAASAAIDGIPCRVGGRATFFWGGQLMGCTLSQDTEIAATIGTADGATQTQRLRCLAGDTVELDGLRAGELGGCRLAAAAEFGDFACAAGERILVSTGFVAACTFAKPARFGPLSLPAGSSVTYYDGRPSDFRLPAPGAAVDGFGLSLPPGAEGAFCYRSEALQRLTVARTAYVVVAGVKLTGFIEFDCSADGAYTSGMLFEDTMVGGKWRQRGEPVSRDDLFPQKGG